MPPLAPVSRTVRSRDLHAVAEAGAPRREHRHSRREAVQEGLAADRADLAGGEEPGRRARRRASSSSTVGVVVGARRTAAPAPVAGEHSAPAGACRPAPRRAAPATVAQVGSADTASRAWRRTTCPACTGAATATVPRVGVGADEAAHQEVAGPYSGAAAVDDDAERAGRPPRARARRVLAAEDRRAWRRARSAGRPPAREMTWPSAAVIVSSGPSGAAPWDTQGRTSTSWKATPTRAAACTSSPRNSDPTLVWPTARWRARRAPARPGRVAREHAEHGVGGEHMGVAEQDRRAGAGGRADDRTGSAGSKTVACPPSSDAVHTATAVARSTSRPAPSDPAGHAAGQQRRRERLADALERRLGLVEMAARGEHQRHVGRPPAERRAAHPARRRSRRRADPVPVEGHSRCVRPRRRRYSRPDGAGDLRSDRCGQDGPRPALAERMRARGERPVAVSADALQVYRGLETLTGVATAAEQARLEHRLVSILPVDARFSAGEYAARPRRDRRPAGRRPRADRRRRHRPLPARGAGRARPAPGAPERSGRGGRASSPRARPPQACTPSSRARAVGGGGIAPPTRRSVRALELEDARRAGAPTGPGRAVDAAHPPPDSA